MWNNAAAINEAHSIRLGFAREIDDSRSGYAMGKFIYDTNIRVDIEDRALAHLQSVIAMKLRRSESFLFTWKEDLSTGSGRTSVWVHPSASIAFKFAGNRPPQLNRAWLHALAYTASSPRGLYLVPEPEAPVPPEHEHAEEMTFRIVGNDDLVVGEAG